MTAIGKVAILPLSSSLDSWQVNDAKLVTRGGEIMVFGLYLIQSWPPILLISSLKGKEGGLNGHKLLNSEVIIVINSIIVIIY